MPKARSYQLEACEFAHANKIVLGLYRFSMANQTSPAARRYNAFVAAERENGTRFPSSVRMIIELGADSADVTDPRTGQTWTVRA